MNRSERLISHFQSNRRGIGGLHHHCSLFNLIIRTQNIKYWWTVLIRSLLVLRAIPITIGPYFQNALLLTSSEIKRTAIQYCFRCYIPEDSCCHPSHPSSRTFSLVYPKHTQASGQRPARYHISAPLYFEGALYFLTLAGLRLMLVVKATVVPIVSALELKINLGTK